LNSYGRFNRQGAIVRLFKTGTTQLVGTRTIDGGSYLSQNAYDAHFGVSSGDQYDVKITFPGGQIVDQNTDSRLRGVNPSNYCQPGGVLQVYQGNSP
jgi:hypothetical protein